MIDMAINRAGFRACGLRGNVLREDTLCCTFW